MSYRVKFSQQHSGAMDFNIGGLRATAIPWEQICEFLPQELSRDAGAVARDLWDRFRFELRDGTNGFGDDFAVLTASVTYQEYIELKERQVVLIAVIKALARVVMDAADESIRFVCFEFHPAGQRLPQVEIPAVVDTGEVVREALRDLEIALRDGRPLSGVDRAHTALHGHLEHILSQAGISFTPDSLITFLFRELTTKHPAFSGVVAHGSHVNNAVSGLARVVDALGPVRNRGSIAHSNQELLDQPEAALFVDSVKTLLAYIERRLAPNYCINRPFTQPSR